MVNDNKKLAFTLAEALVSMLILSIFIGLSMKIFTKKHVKPVYNPTHGYYICYRGFTSDAERNKVYEKIGAAAPNEQSEGFCRFTPVKSANYYVVYAVGAGGGGNAQYGGAPGDFTTLFVTNIADPLNIYPGRPGVNGAEGEPTIIKNPDSEPNNLILSVNGGLPGGAVNIKQEYVRDCKVVALASVLRGNATNNNVKDYVINRNSDKISCTPTKDYFYAELCPHSIHDIVQDKEIYDNNSSTNRSFYRTYVTTASDWRSYFKSTYVSKVFPYKYQDNCLIDGTDKLKYCFDPVNGDKLMKRDSVSSKWYYVNARTDNRPACLTRKFYYNQIEIDKNADSTTVIRTDNGNNGAGEFKYIIDLHYDMSKVNNTKNISPSGFGDYLENSVLKDVTADVLYHSAYKQHTNDVADLRFDPSMGDGGPATTKVPSGPGYPGAVFIAW